MNARSSQWLEWLYMGLGILGLAATNVQVIAYLDGGFVEGQKQFWSQTVTTPAATFILVDLFILGAAILTWLFGECRRVGIGARWAWLYFLGSAFIGISCFFPLFLAHRHSALRKRGGDEPVTPVGAEYVAVAAVVASGLYAAYWSFTHVPGG